MSRITLDDAAVAKLAGNLNPVEIRDSSGKVVGRFIPQRHSSMEPQISEEELDGRDQESGGRQLSEILADFRKRHP